MDKGKSLKLNLSVMRIAACLAIILLHVCSTLIEMYNNTIPMTKDMITFYYVVKIMMKWAVPVFIMITGVLLLDPEKKITTEDILKKYAGRMVQVLIVFGLPMAMIREYLILGHFSFDIVIAAAVDILTMNSWDHLWYIYSLIGIYLILPVLKHFVNHAEEKEMKLVLVSSFVLLMVIPFIMRLIPEGYLSITPFSYWLFYLFLGRYLYTEYTESRLNRTPWLAAGAVSAAVLIIWGIQAPQFAEGLFTYGNPLVGLLAAGIFVLFCYVKPKEKYTDLIWETDRLCFCAYLIHPGFIHVTYQALQMRPTDYMAFYIPATVVFFLVFTAVTFFISKLLRMIPLIRKIT